MQKYAQLTEHKRYQIYILKKAEHTQAYIAKMVGVSASTISRELKRNTGQRGYRPKQAQMKAIQRRGNCDVPVVSLDNGIRYGYFDIGP